MVDDSEKNVDLTAYLHALGLIVVSILLGIGPGNLLFIALVFWALWTVK
jgi:hypothetical protein